MPIRQDVQGNIQPGELASFRGAGGAAAQFQNQQLGEDGAGSAFWQGIMQGVAKQVKETSSQIAAAGYLKGQQDSLAGKERQQVHLFMEESYNDGYNRATVGADLAKYQTELQQKALEHVNSGKSSAEFDEYVQSRTQELLSKAGAQGMDLTSQDWQAWLNGVDSTRNTAKDLYTTKSLERSQYLRQQAYAAEGNAAIGTFVAADEAGNPLQALSNLDAHKARIYSDNTMTLQQKDGAFANFAMGIATQAKSAGAVEGVSSWLQDSEEFKRLPTETQTQIVQGFQSQYNQRAADEVGGLYSYISEVRAVDDPALLEQQYPMASFIQKLNDAQVARQITPAQMFSMVNEENVRRKKGAVAADFTNQLMNGTTVTDIATNTGKTPTKIKQALVQMAATGNGGYSGGGLYLVQRGLKSGSNDFVSLGVEMMQADASSLANIDPKQIKRDADGNALYPLTVVNSLTNLKSAYDQALRSGNQAQASQLLAGLPDAVAYGITQNVDANGLADVVYRRSQDLARGVVPKPAASMPKELNFTAEDVTAGLFDTGLTQTGQRRNILGIQSYVFQSDEDVKAINARLTQVNGAARALYSAAYMQGRLPALEGDELKSWLVGRVAANSVRVEDGTDYGTLLVLPEVQDKAAVYGSTDNNIIGQGLKDSIDAFRKANPGARSIDLQYDSMTNELVVSGYDENNIRLTTSGGIPSREIQAAVRSVEARLTNGGNGNLSGSLAVPGVGMMPFNTQNKFGVDPGTYGRSVARLVSYEGYTDTKGFSILATHPTTGAPLNEEKYVKQPGDSPQVATQKLSMYLQDKVLPDVMQQMPKFNEMPEYLRETVFQQLVETTYHAGNAAAFADILNTALKGDAQGAYKAFRESALYKDAGPESRRNKDRFDVLMAVSQYSALKGTGN